MNERVRKIDLLQESSEESTNQLPNLTIQHKEFVEARDEKKKEDEFLESYLVGGSGDEERVDSNILKKYSVAGMHRKFDEISAQNRRAATVKSDAEEMLESFLVGEKRESLETILAEMGVNPNKNTSPILSTKEEIGTMITFDTALKLIPDDFDNTVLSSKTWEYLKNTYPQSGVWDRRLIVGLDECGIYMDPERTIKSHILVSQNIHGTQYSYTLTVSEAYALLRAYSNKGQKIR